MADVKRLSKVQIGGQTYNLKDEQLVTLVGGLTPYENITALGAAAWLPVSASVTAGATGVVTSDKIKEYVDAQVATIHNFDVVVVDELPAAAESTMYKLYLIPKDGDEEGNVKEEWITVRSGAEGSYTYAWEKIGDTEIDLSDYVTHTELASIKIANVTLGTDSSITVEELSADGALDLKSLAHKSSATGTFNAQTFSTVTAAGSITGDITVSIATATASASHSLKNVASGTIGTDAISGGSITVTLGEDTVDVVYNCDDYTPAGTISMPGINVTAATTSVSRLTNAGTDYAITTSGTVSMAAGTTAAFVTSGLTATVVEASEMLVFGTAPTTAAITKLGDLSYTDPVISGSLPTFEGVDVLTGATAAMSTVPVFYGTKEEDMKLTSATYKKAKIATAEFTSTGTASATFYGTATDITGSITYTSAATVGTGTINKDFSATVSTFTVSAQNITVE